MFDKHIHNSSPAYPQTVNVTNKGAPAADTARLLKELRDEAMESIIATVRVDNNTLKCEWIVVREPTSLSAVARGRVSINGTTHNLSVECDRVSAERSDMRGIADKMHEKIVRLLAGILTTELFRSADVIPFIVQQRTGETHQ